jgi:hypothetical protein
MVGQNVEVIGPYRVVDLGGGTYGVHPTRKGVMGSGIWTNADDKIAELREKYDKNSDTVDLSTENRLPFRLQDKYEEMRENGALPNAPASLYLRLMEGVTNLENSLREVLGMEKMDHVPDTPLGDLDKIQTAENALYNAIA